MKDCDAERIAVEVVAAEVEHARRALEAEQYGEAWLALNAALKGTA